MNTGPYIAFIRNSFLTMLAYRMRYYTGLFTYLIFVSVHYFIWQAVFASNSNGGMVNGYTLPQMVTFVAIGWIARSFYFSTIDDDINDFVRTGQISTFLMRPVDFQLMMCAQAFGEAIFRLAFFSLPIGLLVLMFFPVDYPASTPALVFFLISTMLGFFILAFVNFLVGLAAFYLKSIQ